MADAKCQINLPQINILKQLKGFLAEKPFSSLFGGSIEDLMSNVMGKDLFGSLGLSGSGFPSPEDIKKSLTSQIQEQVSALKNIQDNIQKYKDNKIEILEKDVQNLVESQSRRIPDKLSWYVAAGKQVDDLMTSIKNCSEGIRRSLPSEVEDVVSTGNNYIDNLGEVFRDMKSEDIDETSEYVKAVEPTKIKPSYKVLTYLIE